MRQNTLRMSGLPWSDIGYYSIIPSLSVSLKDKEFMKLQAFLHSANTIPHENVFKMLYVRPINDTITRTFIIHIKAFSG